jgi:hypothetical protein
MIEIDFIWRSERRGIFMTTKSVLDFFAVVKEDNSLQRKTQMAIDLDTMIEIAGE